jgi:hypothetical protein
MQKAAKEKALTFFAALHHFLNYYGLHTFTNRINCLFKVNTLGFDCYLRFFDVFAFKSRYL